MESYWCTQKNSIVYWINKSENFDPALEPCLKTEYARRWGKPQSGTSENSHKSLIIWKDKKPFKSSDHDEER
jgi:hypothetical protein